MFGCMWFCNHVQLIVGCIWCDNVVGLVLGFDNVMRLVVGCMITKPIGVDRSNTLGQTQTILL